MSFDIVVIGSINNDLTMVTPRHPTAGETVLGTRHYTGGGGKGANQAVAAARLGARVALVGRVGDDSTGKSLVGSLAAEGIGVSAIGVEPEAPTGLAFITVDDHAENTIVVSPGANMTLQPEHLEADLIAGASVVLAQLEVPMETVAAAAAMATGSFVLNPAPAQRLPAELSRNIAVLVPNRSELGVLSAGAEPTTLGAVVRAVHRLEHGGATVVTLGAQGAVLVEDDEVTEIPSPAVSPVDPTGAGDAFCGALAHALSHGMGLAAAVRRAVTAGALATTRQGAQAAMPTAAEVEALLG